MVTATTPETLIEIVTDAPKVTAPEVTTADVLNRAADLLEEFGWQQSYLGSKQIGAFCLWGAIEEAYRDFDYEDWMERSHNLFIGRSELPGIEWNDDPGRTKAEVVTALREAAQSA